MTDSWDDHAAEWDQNPDVIRYSERAFRSLTDVANLEDSVVLDFGCGTGRLTERLAPAAESVVALDTSPKMIEVLAGKALSNVTPLCATLAELLTIDSGAYRSRFDLAVASSVCAFVPDYEETLRQLKALLRPGGALVQWDWLSTGNDAGPGFTEDQMTEAILRTGYTSVSVRRTFAMPGPQGETTVLMAVART